MASRDGRLASGYGVWRLGRRLSHDIMESGLTSVAAIRNLRRGFRLLAVILLILCLGFSWLSWLAEKRHESLYLASVAELAGKSLDSYVRHYENALAASGPELLNPLGRLRSRETVEPVLEKIKKANPDLSSVNLIAAEGKMLMSTEALPSGLPDLSRVDSFRLGLEELRQGQHFNIGRPYVGYLAGDWILPLRYPLRDVEGRVSHLLSVALPLRRQQSFWQDLSLPENTALGLIRDDGFLVSRYPIPLKMNYEEAYGQKRSGALYDYLTAHGFPARGETEGYNSVAKEDYIFAFRRLPNYPLTLFVSTPISNVRSKWMGQIQLSWTLLGILLAGSYLIYRWTEKRQLAWEAERAEKEARIGFLAHHDALTELPNRLLTREHFELARSQAERGGVRMALLYLDLDNFKTINDSLGHPVGDAVLKDVSARLRTCLRETDTLGRLGGDEFLIVLPDVHGTDAMMRVTEKIMGVTAELIRCEDHELTTSLSIGIAVYPDDGTDFDTLLKKADTALYQSKAAGRNTFSFFTEQMNAEADEHLRVRQWLRQALEQDYLRVHYQPLLDLESGAVLGAEALVRLEHPEVGMIMPGRFIPIAEDSGLIVAMGRQVLRMACREAAGWRAAGLGDLRVAVNLSAVQFRRGDLAEEVLDVLAESGLPASSLELELTESILMESTQRVLETVRELKAEGVGFSIDDFGTGYSSLSYLKRFDVDRLKIDQSFIRNVVSDAGDAAIVRAVIQMAGSLNLVPLAEGVEDEATLAFLRQHGCREAQGYLFGRPMPAEAFREYLQKRNRPA